MRAKLSVVMPTLNAQEGLQSALPALAEGLEAGLIRELIVSDGGSTDATHVIAQAAGAHLVTGRASRGGQLRRGAEAASGAWLLFLHADSVLPQGWTQAVASHLETDDRPAAFRLRFDVDGIAPTLVAGWANLRSRVFGLPYGDQGLLISRHLYDATGGYADIPLMEDVALARALRGQIRLLPHSMTTSAARYQRDGWFRRGARNLHLLVRYRLGADPELLSKRY